MSPDRKPGFIALIAALAVFLGYGQQLLGQFEHHHSGATPTSHHSHAEHHAQKHHHHDHHHHHAPHEPSEQNHSDQNDQSDCCDQCACALVPALTDNLSFSLPPLEVIDTVPAFALSAPRADTRPIDHPPTA
ncbi:MAG: hypothetical protein AAF591_20565 [Verrucomicrobiota bacterium]